MPAASCWVDLVTLSWPFCPSSEESSPLTRSVPENTGSLLERLLNSWWSSTSTASPCPGVIMGPRMVNGLNAIGVAGNESKGQRANVNARTRLEERRRGSSRHEADIALVHLDLPYLPCYILLFQPRGAGGLLRSWLVCCRYRRPELRCCK